MTTAVTTPLAKGPEAALQHLTHVLRSPQDWNEKDAAEFVGALSKPARASWLLGNIAALLSTYYEKDTPQAIREIEIEDWADALREYPEWAIKSAIRWWKSDQNEYRHRRPIEGDIVARVKVEMGPIRAAQTYLENGIKPGGYVVERQEARCSPEAAAEIMAKAGIAIKTMGK